jgi:hypothetical protein
MALLVGEFIDRAGLTGVTLVQNDWGGAQILIAEGDTSRGRRWPPSGKVGSTHR